MKTNEQIFFDDFQTIWDDHKHRLDQIIDHADSDTGHHSVPDHRYAIPNRLRVLPFFVLLFLVGAAAAFYWGRLIPTLVFTSMALAVSLFIEAVYLFLMAEGIYWTLRLLSSDPARVGIRRSLHYSRHVRGCVSACIAALIALTVASCTTTGIDGHQVTQDHHARMEAIEAIDNLISKI